MAARKPDFSHPAPLSVAPAQTAATLLRFYSQSFGKKVSVVETLFSVAERPEDLSPQSAESVNARGTLLDSTACPALRAATPGKVTGAADPAFSDSALIHSAALEATRIRRIAAADRYPIHRAYPSPRGMFGADVELAMPGSPASSHRLDPVSESLVPIPSKTPVTARNRPTLSVTIRPDRYPAPYGTLRPSLALLEAGHLLATLGLTLQHAGFSIETTFGPQTPQATAGYASQTAGSLTAHARRTGGAASDSASPTAMTINNSAAATLAGLASRGGLLDPRGLPPVTLKEWLDRRSSGSSRHNLVTSGAIEDDLNQFVCGLLQESLAQVAHLLPHRAALRLFHLSLENNDLSSKKVVEISDDKPAQARGVGEFDAPFSSGSGFVWCVDFPAWVEHYGAGADVVVHTLLGWLCQWGCLGAAAAGHTARPARNFDEAEWAAALRLPLNVTPAYQLWIRRPELHETLRNVWTMQGSTQ